MTKGIKAVLALIATIAFATALYGCSNSPDLDSTLKTDHVALKYNSAWNVSVDSGGNERTITPDFGGTIYIKEDNPSLDSYIDCNSSKAENDAGDYAKTCAKGMKQGGVTVDTGSFDFGKSNNAETVTAKASANLDGSDYSGYLWLALNGTDVYSVLALAPDSAGDKGATTIRSVVDSLMVASLPTGKDNASPAGASSSASKSAIDTSPNFLDGATFGSSEIHWGSLTIEASGTMVTVKEIMIEPDFDDNRDIAVRGASHAVAAAKKYASTSCQRFAFMGYDVSGKTCVVKLMFDPVDASQLSSLEASGSLTDICKAADTVEFKDKNGREITKSIVG